MTRSPLFYAALVVMFAGPLAQGLTGASDPNAYLFAPLIAVTALPMPRGGDMSAALRLAGLFLAIGAGCLGLWWLGRQVTPPPLALPGWGPAAISVAGALMALVANRPRA